MRNGCRLLAAILIGSTALSGGHVRAQTSVPAEDIQRQLSVIQLELAARRAEIDRLEQQLAALRRAIEGPQPPAPTPPPVPQASPDGCPNSEGRTAIAMANNADLCAALVDPNLYFQSLRERHPDAGNLARVGRELAARGYNDMGAQALFDRPNLRSGISGGITLGNSSEASISYALPFIFRDKITRRADGTFLGFNPQTLTLSLVVTTPLDSGAGRLFSDTDRRGRANADIPSGTRVRAGLDFLVFPTVSARQELTGREVDPRRSFEAQRRVVDVLHAARQACVTYHGGRLPSDDAAGFQQRYGSNSLPPVVSVASMAPPGTPLTGPVDDACSGSKLVDFLLATRVDPRTSPDTGFANATLPARYLESFWGASAGVLPRWGWGASVEYGTRDFAFEQARSINYAAPDPNRPGSVRVTFDPAQGFDAQNDDTGRANWTLRGYYLRNAGGWRQLNLSDILLVGSVEHSDLFRFRPRTESRTICPANPGGTQIQCRAFNVDAPVQLDYTTAAIEARLRFVDVPFLQNLNLAPRYSYRLDDGAHMIDLPLYLQNDASGFGTAGIRFRHSWGGRDLLGNDELKASELSLFFVPIRFSGP